MDRFDEIKNDILDVVVELDRKLGLGFDDLKDKVQLIAEQVGDNTERLSIHSEKLSDIQNDIKTIKYDIKGKADNIEILSLSRRVKMLEKRITNKR